MRSYAKSSTAAGAWAERWIDSVAEGKATMSQRKLTSIDHHGGGIEVVIAAAQARGVHLLLLIDDQGERLVAASKYPFKVLC